MRRQGRSSREIESGVTDPNQAKMKRSALQSLQTRFTLIVVIVTSGVFGGFGYLNYQSNKAQRLHAVNLQIEKLSQRLAKSLSLIHI